MNKNNSNQLKFVFSFLLVLLFSFNSNGQSGNAIAQWIHSMQLSDRENNFQPVTVFENSTIEKKTDAVFGETELMELQPDALNVLLNDAPATMEFEIPVAGGTSIVLQLAQVNITTDDFSVGTKDNKGNHVINYTDGVHYRGIIKGNDNSIATISVFNNDLVGMISSDEGTFTLGKMQDESERYVFYNSLKSNYHPPMDCFADDSNIQIQENENQNSDRGVACRVVKIYFECDYQMYLDHSSDVTLTANYVTSLFNEVAILYANENIEVQIQQINVWSVTDPYVSYSTASAILPVFSSNNSPFTNGNLAHFLSTRSLGGGVAYLYGLCSSYSCFAVSMVYNSFDNFPTYSWSVMVVTHETGHNLSSPHTHNCSWTGGAIDNCGPMAGYPTEGGCADGPTPTNGGTIMSYCHLNVGINFNNGFGPLPGDKIRNYVINASCVSQNGVMPSGLASSNVSNETATVSWNAVAGAVTYTVEYKKVTDTYWTTAGSTASTSFNLVGLSHVTAYQWSVKTDCSNYATMATFTTINVPACAKPTNLLATNITTTSATISWNPVAAATSYSLQYKLSVTSTWTVVYNITSTSYNLTGLGGSCTYQWKVKANCSNYTVVQHFSTPTVSCSIPSGATATYIGGNFAYLTWNAVTGATYYSVYYKLSTSSNYTLWGNTFYPSAYLQNLTHLTTYNWRVKANCSSYTAKKTFTTTNDSSSGQLQQDVVLNWQINPNPATDFITVNWSEENTGAMEIQLSDITGRILLNRKAEGNETKINTEFLSNGVYFIALKNQDGYIRTGKFIKE